MKWLRIIILVVVLGAILPLAVFPSSPAKAATTADILVKATPDFVGGGLGAPTNFTLTAISNYEVLIEWTKGASANNTMIRAVIGRYPVDITDGYLVYYDTGESVSDFSVDLDITEDEHYYRAWSEDTDGNWSTDYAEGTIGGTGVTLIGFALLALGLTIAMFATKSMTLGFPSAIFWFVLGGYAYTESSIPWGDIYYFLFFASFGMGIFCMFAAYALRTKKEEAIEGDLFFDEGGDKDVKFIDEGGNGAEDADDNGEKPSRRTRDIRDRANKRRSRWE